MDDKNYRKHFAEIVEIVFNETENNVSWSERELSARMKETYANFVLCTEILGEYLSEILGNVDRKKVAEFIKNSKEILLELVEETWFRSLDYRPILEMAFHRSLPNLKIKDCRYGANYLETGNSDNVLFCKKSDRGKSFGDTYSTTYKMWLLRFSEEDAGILMNIEDKDVLLLSVKKVSKLIYNAVEDMMKERKLPFYPSDYSEKAIVTGLLNGHKILAERRSDGSFNRIINYPLIHYDDGEISDEPTIFCGNTVQMIKVNLDVTYDIIEELVNLEMSPVHDWIKAKKILRKLGSNSGNEKALEDALKNINKFLDLK